MIIKDILRVIYSPIKAFKSIVKKPDIKGPFIILVLILVSAAIEQSVLASRILLADRYPKNDEWTESISSSWNWASNGIISLDNTTYAIGNYSVKSTISNSTSLWLKITNIGTLPCSGEEGYKRLGFWMNWTNQLGIFPSNSTLKLFSINESRYELDLTGLIPKYSGNWSIPMIEVAVGSDEGWKRVNNPSWGNITGLEIMLQWSNGANLTMNIDDIYFLKKPFSFLTTQSSIGYVATNLFYYTIIPFFLIWIVYVLVLFIFSWVYRQKIGSFRTLSNVIGYAFAIAIVGILFRAILYLGLPALSLPISSWPPSTSADQIRAIVLMPLLYSSAVYPLTLIATLGLDIWIVALCGISVHELGELTWRRASMFAVIAYLIKFFLPILIQFSLQL